MHKTGLHNRTFSLQTIEWNWTTYIMQDICIQYLWYVFNDWDVG